MPLRTVLIAGILLLTSGCTVQFPLSEHSIGLSSQQPDSAPPPPDEATGEVKTIGNSPPVPE